MSKNPPTVLVLMHGSCNCAVSGCRPPARPVRHITHILSCHIARANPFETRPPCTRNPTPTDCSQFFSRPSSLSHSMHKHGSISCGAPAVQFLHFNLQYIHHWRVLAVALPLLHGTTIARANTSNTSPNDHQSPWMNTNNLEQWK